MRKLDLEIDNDSDEDDKRAGAGKHPTGYRSAVKEQQANADDQRHQRQAECVTAPPVPVGASYLDVIHYQVAAGTRHREPEQEHTRSARAASRSFEAARGFIGLFASLIHGSKSSIECVGGQRMDP